MGNRDRGRMDERGPDAELEPDAEHESDDDRVHGRDRAVAPVVGKALEASIVVLYVALLSSTLYGGIVPDYRTAAGAEVGERALAESAQRVQQAVPADARRVAVRQQVSLPETIRGRGYSVRVENRWLVLDHPDAGIGDRVRLALPPTVDSVTGEWSSHEPAFVVVRTGSDGEGLEVRLESGKADASEARTFVPGGGDN